MYIILTSHKVKRIFSTILPFYLFARVTARRVARREHIFIHIYTLKYIMYSCVFSFKLIGITSENPDGAKRTRTADPLHAMQITI